MRKLQTEIIALCDYALVDQQGKMSIIGIFDEFRADKFPNGFVDKYLVATVHGEPNKAYKLTVKMEKGNSEHNLLNPTIVDVHTAQNGKNNMLVRLFNVGFQEPGEYHFKIYDGTELVGATLLKVIQMNREEKIFRTIN